ncbi:RHS repeat-associated core domain-containing protein, partial [Cronobacter turicensis]
ETIRFDWQGLQLAGEQSDREPDHYVQYVYTEGSYEPLARVDSVFDDCEIYWYHTELNGLPGRVTDADGQTVWRGQFSTWGETERELSVPQWQVPQNLRFQGQYLDRESGLHYNLFRYYDPVAGRYTQMDPIGLAGGINTYSYVGDPLTWVDPLGLKACKPEKWDVNSHQANKNAVKGLNLGLDSHHVGQKNIMKDFIEGYDPATAPAILVPRVGHTVSKEGVGIVSRSSINKKTGLPFTNARDVIARDIRELRRVYPDILNAKLQELIDLNKRMYPELRK